MACKVGVTSNPESAQRAGTTWALKLQAFCAYTVVLQNPLTNPVQREANEDFKMTPPSTGYCSAQGSWGSHEVTQHEAGSVLCLEHSF